MLTYATMGRKRSKSGIMQRFLQGKLWAEHSPTSTRASAHTGQFLAPPVFMPLSDKTFHNHLKRIIYPWKHKYSNLHSVCLHVFPKTVPQPLIPNRPCSSLVDAQTPVEQVAGTEAVPHLWPQCPQLSHLVCDRAGGCWPQWAVLTFTTAARPTQMCLHLLQSL